MFGYFLWNSLSILVIAVTAGGFTQVMILRVPEPLALPEFDDEQAAKPAAARPMMAIAAMPRRGVQARPVRYRRCLEFRPEKPGRPEVLCLIRVCISTTALTMNPREAHPATHPATLVALRYHALLSAYIKHLRTHAGKRAGRPGVIDDKVVRRRCVWAGPGSGGVRVRRWGQQDRYRPWNGDVAGVAGWGAGHRVQFQRRDVAGVAVGDEQGGAGRGDVHRPRAARGGLGEAGRCDGGDGVVAPVGHVDAMVCGRDGDHAGVVADGPPLPGWGGMARREGRRSWVVLILLYGRVKLAGYVDLRRGTWQERKVARAGASREGADVCLVQTAVVPIKPESQDAVRTQIADQQVAARRVEDDLVRMRLVLPARVGRMPRRRQFGDVGDRAEAAVLAQCADGHGAAVIVGRQQEAARRVDGQMAGRGALARCLADRVQLSPGREAQRHDRTGASGGRGVYVTAPGMPDDVQRLGDGGLAVHPAVAR